MNNISNFDELCNINKKIQVLFCNSTAFLLKKCYPNLRRDKLMKEEKKLELMIKNESTYEEIKKQSKKIDQYIDKIVRESI